MTTETFRRYEESLASLFRQVGTTGFNDFYVSCREYAHETHEQAVAHVRREIERHAEVATMKKSVTIKLEVKNPGGVRELEAHTVHNEDGTVSHVTANVSLINRPVIVKNPLTWMYAVDIARMLFAKSQPSSKEISLVGDMLQGMVDGNLPKPSPVNLNHRATRADALAQVNLARIGSLAGNCKKEYLNALLEQVTKWREELAEGVAREIKDIDAAEAREAEEAANAEA